jgi:hypothetical protein
VHPEPAVVVGVGRQPGAAGAAAGRSRPLGPAPEPRAGARAATGHTRVPGLPVLPGGPAGAGRERGRSAPRRRPRAAASKGAGAPPAGSARRGSAGQNRIGSSGSPSPRLCSRATFPRRQGAPSEAPARGWAGAVSRAGGAADRDASSDRNMFQIGLPSYATTDALRSPVEHGRPSLVRTEERVGRQNASVGHAGAPARPRRSPTARCPSPPRLPLASTTISSPAPRGGRARGRPYQP